MINRRTTLKMIGAAGAAVSMNTSTFAAVNKQKGNTERLSRILFGSCANQDKPQPIWNPINTLNPDLFIFLGDNIYADTRDMNVMAAKYKKFGEVSGFQKLVSKTSVIATWDDHDYGENDAGFEYPQKEKAKELFFNFWNEPADSSRRRSDDGIYESYEYGPENERVQIILLDLRWNRTPIHHVNAAEARRRDQMAFGPYIPSKDPSATLLGEKQWAWLEKQLNKPAKIRIIGSSLQFLSTFPGWEAWSLFPNERKRMINLITKTRAEGVLFISGDTHWAEISKQVYDAPYPLYDFTSSGLTETWYNMSPNAYRLPGCIYTKTNFGVIEVDWHVPDPHIVMQARDVNGKPVFEKSLLLSQLSFR